MSKVRAFSTKQGILSITQTLYRLENPQNDDFYWAKSFGIYNCQTWIFHNYAESGNLFPKDLVAKHDPIEYKFQWQPYKFIEGAAHKIQISMLTL